MRWLPLLLLAFGQQLARAADGKLYERLLGKSQFNTTLEIENFILNMQTLNGLQLQLFGLPEVAADPDGKTHLDRVATEQPVRPDLLPYLFEGDIILTDFQMRRMLSNSRRQLLEKKRQEGKNKATKTRDTRSLTSATSMRWTFPIAYWIDTYTGVNAAAVQAGVAKWQEQTCATFQQFASQPSGRRSLRFIRGDGCYSYIGQTGSTGTQEVSIGTGCTQLGTVAHEIGHALGFYHEQSRPERDEFVTVQTRNIQSGYLNQFTQQSPRSAVNYGVRYDYGSVMHYDAYGFSAGGQTIVTKQSLYQSTIGQREEPSFADVKQINFAYCNSTCAAIAAPDCQNGGYQDPKNCPVCRCPLGLAGTLCTDVAPSLSASCGLGDLAATINAQTVTIAGDTDCNYRITAPAGRRVFVTFSTITFPGYTPCQSSFAEIKYSSNLEVAGARICGSMRPSSAISEGQVMLILFKGSSTSRLTFTYRFDPVTPVGPTPTTDAPIPGASTTTTTGTTTTTTTPRPTTSTTQRPVITTTPWTGDCQWTRCTADCGGCGTRTRWCNFRTETEYCNMQACIGNYCCRPFSFSRSWGQCTYDQSGGWGGYGGWGGNIESPFWYGKTDGGNGGRGGGGRGSGGRGRGRDPSSDSKGPLLWSIPVKGAPESVMAEEIQSEPPVPSDMEEQFNEAPKEADAGFAAAPVEDDDPDSTTEYVPTEEEKHTIHIQPPEFPVETELPIDIFRPPETVIEVQLPFEEKSTSKTTAASIETATETKKEEPEVTAPSAPETATEEAKKDEVEVTTSGSQPASTTEYVPTEEEKNTIHIQPPEFPVETALPIDTLQPLPAAAATESAKIEEIEIIASSAAPEPTPVEVPPVSETEVPAKSPAESIPEEKQIEKVIESSKTAEEVEKKEEKESVQRIQEEDKTLVQSTKEESKKAEETAKDDGEKKKDSEKEQRTDQNENDEEEKKVEKKKSDKKKEEENDEDKDKKKNKKSDEKEEDDDEDDEKKDKKKGKKHGKKGKDDEEKKRKNDDDDDDEDDDEDKKRKDDDDDEEELDSSEEGNRARVRARRYTFPRTIPRIKFNSGR